MASHTDHDSSRKHTSEKPHDGGMLLPAILLALACLLLVNGFYIANRLAHDAAVRSNYAYTSHDTATTDSITAAIGKVAENNKPDPAFTLDDGETMLIMDFSITNRTKLTQEFYPTSQLYIRTPVGDYRPLHPSLYLTKPIPSEKLAPGKTLSGQISFGVPASASDLKLYIDTGWNDEAPVVFHVLR